MECTIDPVSFLYACSQILRDRYPKFMECIFPDIKQVIFNSGVVTEDGDVVKRGATIVIFTDNSKVIIRRNEFDEDNKEIAILQAVIKRLLGTPDPATGLVETADVGGWMNRILKNAIVQDCKVVKGKLSTEKVNKPLHKGSKNKIVHRKNGRFASKKNCF